MGKAETRFTSVSTSDHAKRNCGDVHIRSRLPRDAFVGLSKYQSTNWRAGEDEGDMIAFDARAMK